jgi:hypothetical protein
MFSQQWLWSTVFWVVTPCTAEKPEVSEEYIASIFKVEEYAKQETISFRITLYYSPEDRTYNFQNLF